MSTPTFPVKPRGKVRDVLIQPAEAERLIAAFTDTVHRDIAEFYFATGWRGREIRTLRWEHVRTDTVHLDEAYSKTREVRDFPLSGAAALTIPNRPEAFFTTFQLSEIALAASSKLLTSLG